MVVSHTLRFSQSEDSNAKQIRSEQLAQGRSGTIQTRYPSINNPTASPPNALHLKEFQRQLVSSIAPILALALKTDHLFLKAMQKQLD